MIRIRAEILPGGDETKARRLGSVEIANTGGTESVGEYAIRLLTAGAKPRTYRLGKVVGFARKRLGVWDLLLRGLASVLNAQSGRRETIAVPADWQKPIADMTLESAEADRIGARSDEIAEAIRAWLAIPEAERTRVRGELGSRMLGEAGASASRLLDVWLSI